MFKIGTELVPLFSNQQFMFPVLNEQGIRVAIIHHPTKEGAQESAAFVVEQMNKQFPQRIPGAAAAPVAAKPADSNAFPNICKLMDEKQIKLYLQHCKIIVTQTGRRCVVAHEYGAGYYGAFTGPIFRPNKDCTPEMLAEMRDVERNGLEAVNRIGILTGNCCICGRVLTAEESIAGGIGPICAGKVGWLGGEL